MRGTKQLFLFLLLLAIAGCDGRASETDRTPAGEAAAARSSDGSDSAGNAARAGDASGTDDGSDVHHPGAAAGGAAVAARDGDEDETARTDTLQNGHDTPERPLPMVSSARPTTPITIPDEPPRFERPEHVRGIYLNAWASGSLARTNALMALAERTEINTFVIDVKDASGYVSYSTNVPLAREIGATDEIRIRDISLLLQRLQEAGIYPIARIVVFQDPLLANRRPDLAIQDTAGGVWQDGSGHSWVNPYHVDVWDYNIALAAEAARLGFPEIQWDYVRFPDASNDDLARARYPGQDGRKRSIAIRDFLVHGNGTLQEFDGLEVTADVFGVATSATSDVGIGQLWEDFIDVVHVALPMVYPSHYWTGSFGIQDPNDRPYEIVLAALEKGVERSEHIAGAGTIRPWLQDFTLGAPRYGAPEVRAQIQATYDAGLHEWILWNAAGRYTEAALAPAEGFPEGSDPMIRFGGSVVPSSQRFGPLPPEFVLPTLDPPNVIPPPSRPRARDMPARTIPDRVIPDSTVIPDTTAVPGRKAVPDSVPGDSVRD